MDQMQDTFVHERAIADISFRIDRASQLGITASSTEDDLKAVATQLATAKAIENEEPVAKFMKGQQWYVEQLYQAVSMDAATLYEGSCIAAQQVLCNDAESALAFISAKRDFASRTVK